MNPATFWKLQPRYSWVRLESFPKCECCAATCGITDEVITEREWAPPTADNLPLTHRVPRTAYCMLLVTAWVSCETPPPTLLWGLLGPATHRRTGTFSSESARASGADIVPFVETPEAHQTFLRSLRLQVALRWRESKSEEKWTLGRRVNRPASKWKDGTV